MMSLNNNHYSKNEKCIEIELTDIKKDISTHPIEKTYRSDNYFRYPLSNPHNLVVDTDCNHKIDNINLIPLEDVEKKKNETYDAFDLELELSNFDSSDLESNAYSELDLSEFDLSLFPEVLSPDIPLSKDKQRDKTATTHKLMSKRFMFSDRNELNDEGIVIDTRDQPLDFLQDGINDMNLVSTSHVIENKDLIDISESKCDVDYLFESRLSGDQSSIQHLSEQDETDDMLHPCIHHPAHRCYLTFYCCQVTFSCIRCHDDFMMNGENLWYPKHKTSVHKLSMVRCRHCSEPQFPDNQCIECDVLLGISVCKEIACDVVDIDGNTLIHCSSCDVCHIESDNKKCDDMKFHH